MQKVEKTIPEDVVDKKSSKRSPTTFKIVSLFCVLVPLFYKTAAWLYQYYLLKTKHDEFSRFWLELGIRIKSYSGCQNECLKAIRTAIGTHGIIFMTYLSLVLIVAISEDKPWFNQRKRFFDIAIVLRKVFGSFYTLKHLVSRAFTFHRLFYFLVAFVIFWMIIILFNVKGAFQKFLYSSYLLMVSVYIVPNFILENIPHLTVPISKELLFKKSFLDKIVAVCKKHKFDHNSIYYIEECKEGTPAFASSDFEKSYILFFGPLLKLNKEDSCVAVIVHEMSHIINNDVLMGYMVQVISHALMAVAELSIFKVYKKRYGRTNTLISMLCISELFEFICLLIANHYNARHELSADRFSFENGYGQPLISFLSRHFYYFNATFDQNYFLDLLGTHPSRKRRILHIRYLFEKNKGS